MKKMAVSLLVATLFAAPLFAQEAEKLNPEQQHKKMSKHHHKHDKREMNKKEMMPKSDTNATEKSDTMKDAQ
jgi:Ni/Co efflux regulator RcnB